MYYELGAELSAQLARSMGRKSTPLTMPATIRTILPEGVLHGKRLVTTQEARETIKKYREIGNLDLDRLKADAIQAGYINPDGTPNLVWASLVTERYGRCVPKERLSDSDLECIHEAARKINERFGLTEDKFQKV